MPNLAVDVDSWARSACYPRSTFCPLSDGRSAPGRRITRTRFRACPRCPSRSLARLCSCTLKAGCRPARAYLARASVTLWEATAPVKLPTWRGPPVRGLGGQGVGGGIPRPAPRKLALPFLSLPPILYATPRHPPPSCSEGSRGLSVLPRVAGIFTGSAVSPGPWSRQRPGRCAFRAGRNLPDKEFRYLRTVIVTAAVYRGLASPLRLR